MNRIIAHLAVVTLFALLATYAAGLYSQARGGILEANDLAYPLHLGLGLLTVLICLAVHCLVFIYLLGTGRWVKEVAQAYRLPDEPLPRQTRELKRRTFPVALLAMLVPIATAAAGAGVATRHPYWPWQLHFTLGIITVLVNAWAFLVEYRNVSINAVIIDKVMREVDRIRAEHGLPSNAEALKQEQEG
jgi:hypothetical protein